MGCRRHTSSWAGYSGDLQVTVFFTTKFITLPFLGYIDLWGHYTTLFGITGQYTTLVGSQLMERCPWTRGSFAAAHPT